MLSKQRRLFLDFSRCVLMEVCSMSVLDSFSERSSCGLIGEGCFFLWFLIYDAHRDFISRFKSHCSVFQLQIEEYWILW